MTPEQITEEAKHFFEWPNHVKTDFVTLTSCVIFAKTMVQMERNEWVKGLNPVIKQQQGAEQVREAIQTVIRNRCNV